MEYEFLCVTKGGGSANKTYLYQETKAVLNPETLVPFLISKIKTLGTAACPPITSRLSSAVLLPKRTR